MEKNLGPLFVNQPVIDLRGKPEEIAKQDYSHQPNRESQLLFNELVGIIDQHGEWLKIKALEQLIYNEQNGWHAYQGWIHRTEVTQDNFKPSHAVISSSQFSYGTLLHEAQVGTRALPKKPCREQIVADAHLFLGTPYLWGGRSLFSKGISSVDCSGLINLLYRTQGVNIPRNAHDQYLMSQPTPQLLLGDPLFLAKDQRITHVILKVSHTQFIEAPETGKLIRLLNLGEHIWEAEGKIHFFDRPNPYTPYPRTFIVS